MLLRSLLLVEYAGQESEYCSFPSIHEYAKRSHEYKHKAPTQPLYPLVPTGPRYRNNPKYLAV
jgi:hypothetical protein